MLKDKVAIVTGAASGIGFATAEMLTKEGVHVVMADVNEAQLAAAAKKTGADAFAADLSKRDGCRELADFALKNMEELIFWSMLQAFRMLLRSKIFRRIAGIS